jgi:hypothetical protein
MDKKRARAKKVERDVALALFLPCTLYGTCAGSSMSRSQQPSDLCFLVAEKTEKCVLDADCTVPVLEGSILDLSGHTAGFHSARWLTTVAQLNNGSGEESFSSVLAAVWQMADGQHQVSSDFLPNSLLPSLPFPHYHLTLALRAPRLIRG